MKNIDKYINYLEANNKSKHTVINYKSDISQMLNIIKKDEEDIVEDDIFYYVREISNLSSASVGRKITVVKRYFQYLVRKNIIKVDPTLEIENVRIENKNKIPLTSDEIRRMIDTAKNQRDKAIICLFASCGIRFSEMQNITVDDFIKNQDCISIIGKGRKERFIYLSEETKFSIQNYLKVRKSSEHKNLFISNFGNPMSNNCLNLTVKNIAKDAGIDKPVSCHCFRTSNATLMSKNNIPIEIIKESLGHKNISTTMIYIKIAQSQVKEAMTTKLF